LKLKFKKQKFDQKCKQKKFFPQNSNLTLKVEVFISQTMPNKVQMTDDYQKAFCKLILDGFLIILHLYNLEAL
jgi:hypothetical protein